MTALCYPRPTDEGRLTVTGRPVLDLRLGDVLRLRRPHACGGTDWLVDRLGADIGLSCRTCGRHVLLERVRVERRLDGFVSRGSPPDPRGETSIGSSDPHGTP